MTPGRLVQLWRAESRKLLSRTMGRLGLLLAVMLGFFGPLMLQFLASSGGEFNGTPVSEIYPQTAPDALLWSLYFRNLFVMRLVLVGLVALSFAGEFHARTLRDELVQPVPRWAVLLAKWASHSTWLAIGGALSWLVAMVLGAILFGTDGPWRDAAFAWSTTILCDCGFAALALAAAVWIRSVAGTLILMVFFIGVDTVIGAFLWLLETFGQASELPWAITIAIQTRPWLPSHALGLWAAWAGGEPVVWQNIAGLALYTALGLALAWLRFRRMDVP